MLSVSWRALKRGPLLLAIVAAGALVTATTPVLDDGYAIQVLRGAAILLAGGLAMVLDDQSADVLAASPTTLMRRWAARLGLAVGVCAVAWTGALAWAGVVAGGLPWLALSVEAAALAAFAVALAAALRRWRDIREPGALVAPAVFGAVIGANLLPQRWSLLAGDPSGLGWMAAHVRWAAVLLATLVVLVVAAQDPARRRPSQGAGALGDPSQHPTDVR